MRTTQCGQAATCAAQTHSRSQAHSDSEGLSLTRHRWAHTLQAQAHEDGEQEAQGFRVVTLLRDSHTVDRQLQQR